MTPREVLGMTLHEVLGMTPHAGLSAATAARLALRIAPMGSRPYPHFDPSPATGLPPQEAHA
jgi:hypothetical protein